MEENIRKMEKLSLLGINNMYKEDKKIIKEYLKMKYPILAWDHNLDETYDYIGMQCWEFLHNYKNLESKLCDFSAEEKNKIESEIQKNKPESEELNDFYQKSLQVIKILNKYYNEDGTIKK